MPVVFEKTQFEKDVELFFLTTPAPGVHCARSAVRHIERASGLAECYPEMAAFSAITAEEEAATAVFHAIRRRRYLGWEKLDPWDHVQKNALFPFIEAIRRFFAASEEELGLAPKLVFDIDGKKLFLTFNPKRFNPAENVARVIPPLHFSISRHDKKLHDFSTQLASVAAEKGAPSIEKYIRDRANMRNRLLYASNKGIPSITNTAGFLLSQREHVNLHLVVYLLIDPYREKQDFVQQCVLAFLKMLNRLPTGLSFE